MAGLTLRGIHAWFEGHKQRIAYALVAVSMVAAVGSGIVAGFMLHSAANLERQTLRLQRLTGAVFQLQNYTLEAQGGNVGKSLVQRRAGALDAANVAFDNMRKHDPDDGPRLRPTYLAYLAGSEQAFALALTDGGQIGVAEQQRVERQLAAFVGAVNREVEVHASQAHTANPRTRLIIFIMLGAIVILVASLIWQFNMQRRAGRIDRDNAERSRELVRLRDEFVAAVSHELRTPLTSIMGYLDLIRDAKPGVAIPDQHLFLEIVHRNADRLLRLVNDLLFVAEVEGGALSLKLRDVDFSALATESVEAAMVTAASRGVELKLDGGASGHMVGDPGRLAQMMDNLVSNAIKFTPRGGVVTVSTDREDGHVVVEVTDTGFGISVADQEQLYQRFFRARSAAIDATRGTGLGLTITKAIVDAHGGTIGIESTIGVGTKVRVRIPTTQ